MSDGIEPSVTIEGRVARPGGRTLSDLHASTQAVDGVDAMGVRVAELMADAGTDPTASHVTVVAEGEAYRASIPIDALREQGWLVFGDPDGPAGAFRLIVRDGATLCWNVKRVAALRVTDGPEADDVPEQPSH